MSTTKIVLGSIVSMEVELMMTMMELPSHILEIVALGMVINLNRVLNSLIVYMKFQKLIWEEFLEKPENLQTYLHILKN